MEHAGSLACSRPPSLQLPSQVARCCLASQTLDSEDSRSVVPELPSPSACCCLATLVLVFGRTTSLACFPSPSLQFPNPISCCCLVVCSWYGTHRLSGLLPLPILSACCCAVVYSPAFGSSSPLPYSRSQRFQTRMLPRNANPLPFPSASSKAPPSHWPAAVVFTCFLSFSISKLIRSIPPSLCCCVLGPFTSFFFSFLCISSCRFLFFPQKATWVPTWFFCSVLGSVPTHATKAKHNLHEESRVTTRTQVQSQATRLQSGHVWDQEYEAENSMTWCDSK